MPASAEPIHWNRTRQNHIHFAEITVMHGGPAAMFLPEHEHPEIQLGMHFVSRQNPRMPRSANEAPTYCSLIPSGKPHAGGWTEGSEVVVTLLSKAGVERAADELLRPSSFEIGSTPCAVDPVILSMGTMLRREFLAGGAGDPLFVEAVGTVLTGHLVRRYRSAAAQRLMKGKLAPAELRKTLDLIEARISSGIRIAALADQLGMGPHQFTRLFRQTVGCSPYRFVMVRRIELARVLLEKTTLPLAEIALELGFASQSHFTSAFHREARTTPQSYRSCFRQIQ